MHQEHIFFIQELNPRYKFIVVAGQTRSDQLGTKDYALAQLP